MIQALLSLVLALAATPVAAQDIFVRDSADGWGRRIAAHLGIAGVGRSIAVIVAVGDYRAGWPPLEAPARDAERVRDFLVEEAEFDRVYTFVDEEATYEALRKLMLEELPGQVGSDDRLLFYFSGHGTQRRLYGDRVVGYLPLQASSREGWSSMIAMDDLERWWDASSHARQSLFILDACFSGLGLQSKSGDLRQRTLGELGRRGHHIFTAGTEDQESYASISRWGGSLFTTALIDGMSGYADASTTDFPRDGVVSLKELWDYVGMRIRSEVPPNTMTPQLAGFEFSSLGEFFFVAEDALPDQIAGNGPLESKGGAEDRLALQADPMMSVAAAPNAVSPESPDDLSVLRYPETAGTAAPSGEQKAFRDCALCPEMVVLPPGTFDMGSDVGPDSEKPQHRISIPQAFAMGRTEVTVGEWRACVSDGGCMARADGESQHPVTAVNLDDVEAYLDWISQRSGKDYRLPTEAEWEYSAKAGDARRYPTGAVVLPEAATFGGRQDAPSPVASHPANPFGLHDLAGNVWEWVADCAGSYTERLADTSERRQDCQGVLRGGSWRSSEVELRSTNRFFYPHDEARADFGFRVARSHTP